MEKDAAQASAIILIGQLMGKDANILSGHLLNIRQTFIKQANIPSGHLLMPICSLGERITVQSKMPFSTNKMILKYLWMMVFQIFWKTFRLDAKTFYTRNILYKKHSGKQFISVREPLGVAAMVSFS